MARHHQHGVTASSISLTALALTTLISYTAALPSLTSKGCFSSSNGLEFQDTYQFQSTGWCQQQCVTLNKPVMGLTNGGDCWCGDMLPPLDSVAPSNQCNIPCNGYNQQTCGGNNAWGVYLTGTSPNVANAQDSNNNPSSSAPPPQLSTIVSSGPPVVQTLPPATVTASGESTTLPPSVVTVGAATEVVTVPASTATVANAGSEQAGATPTASSKTSTGTKVGIVVGAVVAVIALAVAVGVGVFYFLKKKRSQYSGSANNGTALQDGGLMRNNTFHSHSTSGGFGGSQFGKSGSVSDSRLDPGMVETRRGSLGSVFDDSEDYSRRVLKVVNAEG